MLGRYVPVRAEVVDLGSFSVHADRDELAAWIDAADRPPELVSLVHGEPDAAEALRSRLDTDDRLAVVARDGERLRLD
jgi:metallo-beta-lactamase family protein